MISRRDLIKALSVVPFLGAGATKAAAVEVTELPGSPTITIKPISVLFSGHGRSWFRWIDENLPGMNTQARFKEGQRNDPGQWVYHVVVMATSIAWGCGHGSIHRVWIVMPDGDCVLVDCNEYLAGGGERISYSVACGERFQEIWVDPVISDMEIRTKAAIESSLAMIRKHRGRA
jgi:hypothetical protein